MTHQEPHTDPQVEQLLSTIETHAKNVRRQAALLELVDNLAASAKRRPLWPYWAGIAVAACMALVLAVRQKDAPQMAMNTTQPPVAIMHEENNVDATPGAPRKVVENKYSDVGLINNPQAETATDQPSAEEVYVYSETESGIRVYCENQCNAEEVVSHMEEIVRLSIAAL